MNTKQTPSKERRHKTGSGILDERDFLQILYLERRRSERSGRPLCLILMDSTSISEIEARRLACCRVLDVLRGSIRETDTVGWHKENETFAVLFPESGSQNLNSIGPLRSKVGQAVSAALTEKLSSSIRITVHIFPTDSDLTSNSSDHVLYPDLPLGTQRRQPARIVKRVVDVAGSSMLLLLTAPFVLAIAAIIKITSNGPVVFRQKRVGEFGKEFTFFKFRSMKVDCDATVHRDYVKSFITQDSSVNTEGVYKITKDSRVTPLGRWLRKTSLDELPQLWNVLRGEMSLVGPRPPLPYELDSYALWHRRRVQEAKPGITGLWQVMGRSRTTFNEMVRLDLRYVQNWSMWLDLKIILHTPKAVFKGEGAY